MFEFNAKNLTVLTDEFGDLERLALADLLKERCGIDVEELDANIFVRFICPKCGRVTMEKCYCFRKECRCAVVWVSCVDPCYCDSI